MRRLCCLDFFTGPLIHFNWRLFVWLSDWSSSCLSYMVWQTLPSFSLMLSKPETSKRPYIIWTRSFLGSDCMVSCRKTQIHVDWNIYYLQYNNIVQFILKEFILWRWLTHFTASFQMNNQTWFMKCSEYVRREWVCLFHTWTERLQFSERKQEQEGVWIMMTQHYLSVTQENYDEPQPEVKQRSLIHRIDDTISVTSVAALELICISEHEMHLR